MAAAELTESLSGAWKGAIQKSEMKVSDDVVVIGTRRGAGMFRNSGDLQYFNTCNSGLVCNQVYSMAQDAEGGIWFATANGISSFRNQTKSAKQGEHIV